MDTKKFLLSALAGFAGLFLSGGLLEELIFKGYMQKTIYQPMNVSLDQAPFWPILVMIFFMGLIMAYMYPKGYAGGSPATEGLRFGGLLGLFLGIPFALFLQMMFAVGFVAVLAVIVIYTVEVAAGGVLIGLVYGRIKPAE